MNGRIERVPSVPDAFARLVAGRLAEPRDGGFSLFLSGGDTARACYERLAEFTTGDGDGPVRLVPRGSTGPRSTSTWATSGACRPTTPTPTTG